MDHLLITYKLKNNALMDDFKKYSLEIDQPTVNRQKGVHKFEVFEISQPDSESSDFDVVENIFVDSYDKWNEITKNEEMVKNISEWDKYGDSKTVRVYIKKIIK